MNDVGREDGAGERKGAMDALRSLLGQIEQAVESAGERVTTFAEDAEIKRRLSDAVDALDDVRLTVLRKVRGEPATRPLEEMTVRELHELASEREIPGRSSMNKAELIDALRKG